MIAETEEIGAVSRFHQSNSSRNSFSSVAFGCATPFGPAWSRTGPSVTGCLLMMAPLVLPPPNNLFSNPFYYLAKRLGPAVLGGFLSGVHFPFLLAGYSFT